MNSKLNDLVNYLLNSGYAASEVEATIEAVTKTALLDATAKMTQFIHENQLEDQLDGISDEKERNAKIEALYEEKTGQTAKDFAESILNQAAEKVLAEAQKEDQSSPTTS